MSTGCEVLAYLSLDDHEPQRSGERLIQWAAVCQADGIILPVAQQSAPGIVEHLVTCAAQARLRCYVAPQPYTPVPKRPGIDGYYIDAPDDWSRAALQDLGRPFIRVQDTEDATRYGDGLADARLIYLDRDGTLRTWLELCQVMQRKSRLPGYFDEHAGIGHALERAAYAPLVIKRLALSRGQAGLADNSALTPYEFGQLVRHARGIREQLAAIRGECAVGEPDVKERRTAPGPGVADIAIVIRSKNEAEWLGRTLEAIARQRRQPKEIVLVDNESTDDTVRIARRFHETLNLKIVAIRDSDFNFSRALNWGIEQTTASWIISLSAHCIPVNDDWLAALEQEVLDDAEGRFFAGVYGRQEPVDGVTSDLDKRDLWTTFGTERRVQLHDFFFHNANSMIRRSAWAEPDQRLRFNEAIHGVEDRDWAEKVLRAGYAIVYTPKARVYHYHGIHHGRNEERAKRVVKVIELIHQRQPVGSP